MPGEPTPYTDIGGGGDLPPHGEDYFNRIVNVHWPKRRLAGENIFVLGDFGAFNCFVGGVGIDTGSGDAKFTTTPLGTLGFGGEGEGWTYGSSSHTFSVGDKTVFVLVGFRKHPEGSGGDGIIMASTDGLKWSQVYTLNSKYPVNDPTHSSSAEILGVVWDDNMFYAGAHQWTYYYEIVDGVNSQVKQEETDILLRSSDGMSWSEAGRIDYTTWLPGNPDISPPPQRGMLVEHCPSHGMVDYYGNDVPDGMYHYSFDPDTQREIFIRPNRVTASIAYDFGSAFFGDDTAASSVLIDIKEGGTTVVSTVSSPGIPVMAVGYSGGVIIAVGGPAVGTGQGNSLFAVSYDMGTTWTSGSYVGYSASLHCCG